MKLFTHPFSDTFNAYDWANDPVFEGYKAVIPRFSPNSPTEKKLADELRQANARRVIECAIDDLRAQSRAIRGRKRANREARAAFTRRIKRLELVRETCLELPNCILVNAMTINTYSERTGSGTFIRRQVIQKNNPGWILVLIEDIQKRGMSYAIRMAKSRMSAKYMLG